MPVRSLAQTAFDDAVTKFNALKSGELPLPSVPHPKRLVNIYTGAIESGASVSKPFVIASYVWCPERLPPMPTYGWVRHKGAWDLDPAENSRPGAADAEKLAAPSPHFGAWATLLASRYPDIVSLAPPTTTQFRCPPVRPDGIDPVYLEEVFSLVAAEAHACGVSHVWMDSLCVDQTSGTDKAEEIPKMRDYYAAAAACVVVSESVRRRVAPVAAVPAAVSPDSDVVGANLDSPVSLVECWAVGFHDERVWTLQETLQARRVVSRAGAVRIDTTKLLDPATRKRYGMATTGSLLNALPTGRTLTPSGVAVTPHYCFGLSRNRGAKYDQDKVYGILGLFPERVRYATPVDYALSPAEVVAVFSFLRVADGDLSAVPVVWDERYERNDPKLGPSWCPAGFAYPQTEIIQFVPHEGLAPRIDEKHALHLTMGYLTVAAVIERAEWEKSHGPGELADLMDAANVAVALPGSELVYGGTVETVFSEIGSPEKVVMAALGKDPRTLEHGASEDVWVWLLLEEKESGWSRHGVVLTDKLELEDENRFRIV